MRAAGTTSEPHDAYLHALNRAMAVAVALSFAMHAVLIGSLPNPFGHLHPAPHTLVVELVEAPAPPAPIPLVEPQVQQPSAPPIARATPVKPSPPMSSPKPVAEPKPARERRVTAPVPAVREPDRLLTHAEPEKAVTTAPAPPAATPPAVDKPAATSSAATDLGATVEPETPPSFRAGYLHNPEPAYPTASRRLGEQGTVQLRVVVSAEGRAVSVGVQRSSSFRRLDEAASEAVRNWRFVPAKRGATPVEAAVIVPIVFRLEPE